MKTDSKKIGIYNRSQLAYLVEKTLPVTSGWMKNSPYCNVTARIWTAKLLHSLTVDNESHAVAHEARDAVMRLLF